MTTRGRTPVIPTGVEVALAFCAGVASFALLAVTLAVSDSDLLAVALGVASVGAIVAITRVWGVAYAVPAAMAGLVAYDWFQFPPTHPREFPSSGDLANLLVYLAVAVLVGVVAAHAGRRAVSSEQARGLLAEEQAALRRVATLVAQGVPPSELFGTVAEELGRLLGTDLAGMLRYETDDTACVVAAWAASGEQPEAGGRRPLDEAGLATTIRTTGRPARIEDPDGLPAGLALRRDERAIRSSVGSPIVVERRLWGVLAVHSSRAEPLPADTESRVKEFTDLVATAISNTEARAEVARLANEQAALRRVATLVAQESTPAEVFAAVAEEVGRRFEIDDTAILRYERDGTATAVAEWGEHSPACPVREPREPGRRQRHGPGPEDGPARAHRRLLAQRGRAGGRGARQGPSLGGRQSDRRRRAAVGRHRRGLAGSHAVAAGHRGAHRGVHRAGRHRDLEHPGAVRPRRLPRADRRGDRRGAPAGGARSARRRAAAPRPHGRHAQAGPAGAAQEPGRRSGAGGRGAASTPRSRPASCASSPTASSRPC